MKDIPKSHPRYESLITREKISQGLKDDLVHETGLIAHGRGEAFDYLIGEKTVSFADEAEKVTAALLLLSKKPVISVNGNVVALTSSECVSLSKTVPADIEVNLFHRTEGRVNKLINRLLESGAEKVLGENADAHIPGLDHDRALCEHDGIFSSDTILVPLEDGDRCQALKKMGKTVIAVDLNPLSRTSKTADVTVVDNVTRALPNIEKWVKKLRDLDKGKLERIVEKWDNRVMLKNSLELISKRLNSMY